MHEILDSFEEINLDVFEYCTLTQDTKHYAETFPMYVPKLMAGITYAPKASWTEPVSNCYVNSDNCKIAFSRNVQVQNYLTIGRFFESDFKYRADINDIVKRGTQFMLQSMYGDPKSIKLVRVV